MSRQFEDDGWFVPDYSAGASSRPPPAVRNSNHHNARFRMPQPAKYLVGIALVVVITLYGPFQFTRDESISQGQEEAHAFSVERHGSMYLATDTAVMERLGPAEQGIGYHNEGTMRPGRMDGSTPIRTNDGISPIGTHPALVKDRETSSWNSSEPSHVQICRITLSSKASPSSPQIISEHQSVCLDESRFPESVIQIFLSSYLSHSARHAGVTAVDYRYGCASHRDKHTLIQELLPSPLLVPDETEYLSREELALACQGIVDEMSRHGAASALDMVLDVPAYDAGGPTSSSSGSQILSSGQRYLIQNSRSLRSRMLPMMQTNVHDVVQTSLRTGNHGAVQFMYGVLNRQHTKSGSIAMDTAALYLSCTDTECKDTQVIPYVEYLLRVPSSVRVVDVVVAPPCPKNSLCKRYAEDLASTIRQFLPGTSVELIPSSPATVDSFARLVTAEHVLCSPGDGGACLFASLTESSTKQRFTIFRSAPSASNGIDTRPSQLSWNINHSPSNVQIHPRSTTRRLLTFQDGEHLSMFSQQSPDPSSGDCRFVRGRVGQWIKDMEYAQQAQYRTPLRHYSGNAEKLFRKKVARGETGGLQYRPSTTYRWQETRYETCNATLISLTGVCELLRSMNARRIFILGDSLSLQLAQSIWMWLSHEGDSPLPRGTLEPNFRHTLACPINGHTSPYEFVLQFIRNDKLMENDQPVSIDKEIGNCGTKTYCYPWTAEYTSSTQRTIMLVNIGAHIHSFDDFRLGVDGFVSTFDSLNRPDDVILFRTTVPGHWNCDRPGLVPFHSFQEYLNDEKENHIKQQDDFYSWSQFSLYNAYAARKIYERQRWQLNNLKLAQMEMLDVVPMTVLRPDGHCSDEFRPDNYLLTDCLHYTLPGPIDWWSHLAFSHLLDIARSSSSNRKG